MTKQLYWVRLAVPGSGVNPMQEEIHVLENSSDLFHTAAQEFATQAESAVRERGVFRVALSGGSTPKTLYSLLASPEFASIPWEKIQLYFGDERDVPPDDPESNYRMANEAMISKIHIPPGNVFRVQTEGKTADQAAAEYEQTIGKSFALKPGEFPRFDLILLGMGPDGHTASLFPGSAALNEQTRAVVANWVDKFQSYRITFTYPVLNNAACVMFLASGPEKAEMIRNVLEEHRQDLPSARVHPTNGRLVWMLDQLAAAGLSRTARA